MAKFACPFYSDHWLKEGLNMTKLIFALFAAVLAAGCAYPVYVPVQAVPARPPVVVTPPVVIAPPVVYYTPAPVFYPYYAPYYWGPSFSFRYYGGGHRHR